MESIEWTPTELLAWFIGTVDISCRTRIELRGRQKRQGHRRVIKAIIIGFDCDY